MLLGRDSPNQSYVTLAQHAENGERSKTGLLRQSPQ
jgi:hypothetical protein